MLEIRGLKINYGPISVIKGIDMVIPRGKIVALLGAKGAGKTTTLRAISGLVKTAEGEILFEGKNIANNRVNKIVDMGISHAPEGRRIFTGFTVEENLRAGAYSLKAQKGTDGKTITASEQYDKHLKRVYQLFPVLEERKKQQAHTLSGGEQQMLAIGRALMTRPRLLLLDEPFVGLDPKAAHLLKGEMRRLCDAGGAIFFSTHVLEVAEKLCDNIAIIKDGRLVKYGETELVRGDSSLENVFLELEGK